jgi:quercetin dioxygenase-like cupin family protein
MGATERRRTETAMIRTALLLSTILLLAACTSGSPKVPYPAFVVVDELEDMFMASLPGIRAKQLAGDPQTRRTSNRIDLPPDWKGTSGGSPGRSTEMFVLDGSLTIADIELPVGGYIFLPAGSLGFNIVSKEGARILYFVNDTDPESIIRSPIIIDANLLPWEPTKTPGVMIKELRRDPGNGAATWLQRIEAGRSIPWQSSTALREGYLMSGQFTDSECVLGEVLTWSYAKGGYFYRPPGAVHGGPESGGDTEAIWFLRETEGGTDTIESECAPIS